MVYIVCEQHRTYVVVTDVGDDVDGDFGVVRTALKRQSTTDSQADGQLVVSGQSSQCTLAPKAITTILESRIAYSCIAICFAHPSE